MDPRQEQIRLQALFSELRQDDERRAPSFRRCVQAADERGSDVARPVGRLALAVAMLLAVLGIAGLALFSHVHRGGTMATRTPVAFPEIQGDATAIQSLSTWQSPTAFLLDVPNLESKPASRFDQDWMIPSRPRDRQPLF